MPDEPQNQDSKETTPEDGQDSTPPSPQEPTEPASLNTAHSELFSMLPEAIESSPNDSPAKSNIIRAGFVCGKIFDNTP